MPAIETSRRHLIAGGGLAALALAMPAGAAAPRTAQEQANLELVMAYIAAWSSGPFDPDVVMPRFFAPDARIRVIDSAPVVIGPAAAAAAFKPYLANGERFIVETLETFVRGPLVMTSRIDTQSTPGKPEQKWPVVGVFMVRDSRIHEWTDFVVA